MHQTAVGPLQVSVLSRAHPASPRWHWPMLVVVLPATLTLFLPDWMYSQSDYIDAWVYHGFFRHLESYAAEMFRGTYYGSRLGWIVPGYVAYHLFPPIAATVVLHLTFYLTAVLSLYVIVRSIASASSALFAAIAFGLYLPTVRSLGSDYVDGPVITYALVSVMLLMRGVSGPQPLAIVASGVAAGAMLNSNIGAAFMAPSILVWLLLDNHDEGRAKAWLRDVFLWGTGIVACTALLSVISALSGGSWLFFLQSVRWIQNYRLQNPWDVAGLSWVGSSPWVFLPLATLLAAVVVAVRSRHHTRLALGQACAIASLMLLLAIFVLWDFVGSGSLLYWPFYASWLVPWTFIAIGAVLVPAVTRIDLEAVVVVVGLAVLGVSLMWLQHVRIPGFGFPGLFVVIGMMLVAALSRSAIVSRVLVVAAVVCLHGWLPLTNVYLPGGDRADAFKVIDRGVRIIERYVSTEQPRFLLTPPRRLGHYVQGLTSVYLWGYTIATDRFPTVTPAQAGLLKPGVMTIVISEEADAARQFDDALAPYHLRGVLRGSERVDTAHGPLYLTFFEAADRPDS